MNKDLSHLPQNRRDDLQRVVEFMSVDELLKLAEECCHEKIALLRKRPETHSPDKVLQCML